jgi:hypothetical protein
MHKRAPLESRLYQRPDSGVWWFWGYDHAGKRYRVGTGQTDRKAALAAASAEERRRSVPPDPTAAKPEALALTLEAALRLLKEEDVRNAAAKNTLAFHRDRGRHLVRLLHKDCLVAGLELADVNRYTDLRLAEGEGTLKERHTIQKEIRVLLHALAVAREAGLYVGDPKRLKPKAFRKQSKFYKAGTTWLRTAEQCNALVTETSSGATRWGGKLTELVHVDRKLDVLAYIHTGVRRRELNTILPEHVHMAERYVEVDGTKTDGAKRKVALSATALEVFERKLKGARRGKPLFAPWGAGDRDLKANWLRARARLIHSAPEGERDALEAQLPSSLNFNDLRRTFCSLMAGAGVPLHHCADLMGHKSLAMVMEVYRQISPTALHEAVGMLPALALPPLSVAEPIGVMSRRERQRLFPGRPGRKAKAS